MSRNDPTEILVAVHADLETKNAVLVSINGESRKLISSYHLIGTSTEGTDDKGKRSACRRRLARRSFPCSDDGAVSMTIPSPRKFIEIVLCFMVASVVLSCLAVVLIVLAVFAAIESVVDRFKVKGRAQR